MKFKVAILVWTVLMTHQASAEEVGTAEIDLASAQSSLYMPGQWIFRCYCNTSTDILCPQPLDKLNVCPNNDFRFDYPTVYPYKNNPEGQRCEGYRQGAGDRTEGTFRCHLVGTGTPSQK